MKSGGFRIVSDTLVIIVVVIIVLVGLHFTTNLFKSRHSTTLPNVPSPTVLTTSSATINYIIQTRKTINGEFRCLSHARQAQHKPQPFYAHPFNVYLVVEQELHFYITLEWTVSKFCEVS